MRKTLQQILNDVGAEVDQDTSLPTGTELTVRVNLVQQALEEWAESYEWKQLRGTANATFAFSGTSVGLSLNFEKLMSPLFDLGVTPNTQYDEIKPEQRIPLSGASQRFVVIRGDEAAGKYLQLSHAMGSGASIIYDYRMAPSGMATLSDVCVCPRPTFIVKKVVSRILRSRSDPRFPQVEADAQLVMDKMLEDEDTNSRGMVNKLPTLPKSTTEFRIGRD